MLAAFLFAQHKNWGVKKMHLVNCLLSLYNLNQADP